MRIFSCEDGNNGFHRSEQQASCVRVPASRRLASSPRTITTTRRRVAFPFPFPVPFHSMHTYYYPCVVVVVVFQWRPATQPQLCSMLRL